MGYHGNIDNNQGYVIIQNNDCSKEKLRKILTTLIFFSYFYNDGKEITFYKILKDYCGFDFSHSNNKNNFEKSIDFQPLQLSGSCTYFSVHHYMRYVYYVNNEYSKFNDLHNFIKLVSVEKLLTHISSYIDNKMMIPNIMKKNIEMIEFKIKDLKIENIQEITKKIKHIKAYIQNQYINPLSFDNILKSSYQYTARYQLNSIKEVSGYLERLYNGRKMNIIDFIQENVYDYVYMMGDFVKISGIALSEITINLFINSLIYSYQNSKNEIYKSLNEIYKSLNENQIIKIIYQLILALIKFYSQNTEGCFPNYNNVCYVPLYWTFFLIICKIHEYSDIKLFTSDPQKTKFNNNTMKYFFNHEYKSLQEKYYTKDDINLLNKYAYLLECHY